MKRNPFKWHVVQLPNGMYAVRRLAYFPPLFWVYSDTDASGYTWTESKHVKNWCLIKEKDRAISLAMGLNSLPKVVWP